MTDTKAEKSLISVVLESNLTNNLVFQVFWCTVRVVASVLMIHNGFNKLADVPGFAENVVVAIGLPFPVFFTYCAAYAEIVGAIFLALGLLTRLSAGSLVVTMLVAIYFHLKVDGIAIKPLETAALYGLIYLLFAINGSGLFALDTWLNGLLTKKEE